MNSSGDNPYLKLKNKIKTPLLCLRDIVIFPNQITTVFIGRPKSIKAIEEASLKNRLLVTAVQKNPDVDDPGEDDVFRTGTLCTILNIQRFPNDTLKIQIQGIGRVKILNFKKDSEFIWVECELVRSPVMVDDIKEEAAKRVVISSFENYIKVQRQLSPDILMEISSLKKLGDVIDAIAANISIKKVIDKQFLLEENDPIVRGERLTQLINSEIEVINIQRRIQSRVRRQMDRDQKEYYLNLQKQAISKELGEGDEFNVEFKELEEKIASKQLSKEAKLKAERELKKLKMMSPMSSEAAVIRNYLDWIVSIPWGETSNEEIDIEKARKIIDEDHYGLEKVKERIIEYIAVGKLAGHQKGPILCLVGPPGVGKTSLGSSIARACGRKFVRVSLGGVRDEAEIRGHRRTYIGAYPGKIIYGMKRAGVINPVFLLDEVDKMTVDYRGDPAAALLEVLDPEQNSTFVDHFLDVDYDLSHVMFITTANTVEGIPLPLLDRMEVLELNGYTEIEKLEIASKFLIPKQKKLCGIENVDLEISSGAIKSIIQHYTREAGVRNLEREIASICRKIACQILDDKGLKTESFKVNQSVLFKMLGPMRYRVGVREKTNEVGVCNGLAFTSYGGDILQVEVSIVQGKGKLLLTGKLGDVMKESAQAAVSYLRKRASLLGIDADFYMKNDIHVHFPEGGVPKDGPSAGISIATALASALLNVPIDRKVALTGEITLRGKVLPVGGIKEKLVAAARGKIRKVIIPAENRKDLVNLPVQVRRKLTVVLVNHMDEVLREALVMEGIEKIFPSQGVILDPIRDEPLKKKSELDDDDMPVVEITNEGDELRFD